jgi:glycerol-3-phosphate acyltransferase PlsY
MWNILSIPMGYLCGSISTAILVCRVIGAPDPRTAGSGNPGATNVLRVAGKNAAAATLIGDSLKGLLPVLLARMLNADAAILALTAIAAFLGHLYPVFFRFRGGKGVATLTGVLLGLAWPLGLSFIAVWLLMAAVFRISSLSALAASALAPVLAWWWQYPQSTLWVTAGMATLLYWRHRSNIRHLLAGTEDRMDRR